MALPQVRPQVFGSPQWGSSVHWQQQQSDSELGRSIPNLQVSRGQEVVYVSMGCGVSKEEWREAVSIAARDAKEDALKKAELMLMQRRLH